MSDEPKPVDERRSFRPSELLLPYSEWEKVVREKTPYLDVDVVDWMAAWDFHDFAVSPRDDNKRRLERYPHYLGWFAAREAIKNYSATDPLK